MSIKHSSSHVENLHREKLSKNFRVKVLKVKAMKVKSKTTSITEHSKGRALKAAVNLSII